MELLLLYVDEHVGVGAVPRRHHLLALPAEVGVNRLLDRRVKGDMEIDYKSDVSSRI